MVRRYVEQGITKFVLIPAGTPASWDDELGWLSPIVRGLEDDLSTLWPPIP